MEIKQKKCRVCSNFFAPYKTTDIYCSPKCAYSYKKTKQGSSTVITKEPVVRSIRTKSSKYRSLDQLWSKIVRLRAGNKCEVCNGNEMLSAHHIFTKGAFPHLKYDIDNGVCLCANHHTKGEFSAHLSPEKFMKWFFNYKGSEFYRLLELKAKRPSGVKLDTDIVYTSLKQVYKSLKFSDNR